MEVQRVFRFKSGDELLEEFDRLVGPLGLSRREIKVLRVLAGWGQFRWDDDERIGWLVASVREAARLAGCAAGTWLAGVADLECRGLVTVIRRGEPWTYVAFWSRIEAVEPAWTPAAEPPARAQTCSDVSRRVQSRSDVFNRVQPCSGALNFVQPLPNGEAGGETPRTHAGAPDTSSSSSSSSSRNLMKTKTEETTDEPGARAGEYLREAAAYIYQKPPEAIPREARHVLRRLAWLAVLHYDEDWVRDSVRDATAKSRGAMQLLKAVAAEKTGDRPEFFRRFDALRIHSRSPPGKAES